jgi:hypothetical protein
MGPKKATAPAGGNKTAAKDNCPSGPEDCGSRYIVQPAGPGGESYVAEIEGQKKAKYYPEHLQQDKPHCLYLYRAQGKTCSSCNFISSSAYNARVHAICKRKHYICAVCSTGHPTLKVFEKHAKGIAHQKKQASWVFEPASGGKADLDLTEEVLAMIRQNTEAVAQEAEESELAPYDGDEAADEGFAEVDDAELGAERLPDANPSRGLMGGLVMAAFIGQVTQGIGELHVGGRSSPGTLASDHPAYVPDGPVPFEEPGQSLSEITREEEAKRYEELKLREPVPVATVSDQVRILFSEVIEAEVPYATMSTSSDISMQSASG